MLSTNQIQLNVVRAYTARMQELFTVPTQESEMLFDILATYEWHLELIADGETRDLYSLPILKSGIRKAGLLYHAIIENRPQIFVGWFMGKETDNPILNLCTVLCEVITELGLEIAATERLFPDLKNEFEIERQRYRIKLEEAETYGNH